ncbi:pyridoxal phosphate-dependent aminotransferase [Streptobacillus moniliformis]|uniref:pyridoxal phosphate-dependent aminotransferase n=1 Tax=Streptobacillus moniliformis TaxID=34105 RepID=UPI0007E4374C|nr:pyridoxal phosphate-dependent aminotransferase [Streptobacillus moniliformis]
MKLSDKVLGMQYSPIRKFVPFADKAKKEGVKIFEFHIGQPDVKTPDSFFNGVTKYQEKIIKYTNSQGLEELLDAFVEDYSRYNLKIDKKEILITNGGSEALQFAINTICNKDDEVLVPEPYYSNYDSFLRIADAKLVPIVTKIEEGYRLPSYDKMKKLITPKTKAILFSNPSNPTGVVLNEREIEDIKRLALEFDLFIISDEVYRQFIYDVDTKFRSFLSFEDVSDRVIMIDSISKHYSACGARIGILASRNAEIIAQSLKLCQARLSVSTIEQYASANLVRGIDVYIDDVRAEYRKRRDLMYEKLSLIEGVKANKPDAAFYIFASLPVNDTEEFNKWLLCDFRHNGKTLMFASGNGFYSKEHRDLGKNELRFSFCGNNLREIEEGINLLEIALKEYNEKH